MERVYRRIMSELLDDIAAGRLAPGGWLPTVDQIADRHACSAGAVREAIRALEERKVIDVRAGQGQQVLAADHWTVLDRDVAEAALLRHSDTQLLREAVDAVRLFEVQGAMLAARRVRGGDLALLDQTLDRMRESIGSAALAAAEEDFHRTLMLISGNRFLASALQTLHGVIPRVRRERAPERDKAVVRAHEVIMAALGGGDASAAAAAIEGYTQHLASWLRL
jgi:DNA-binding FadR family transcriptional regulator